MNKTIAALMLALATIGICTLAQAEQTEGAKPAVLEAEAKTAIATVESIDYKTRTVTLKSKEGKLSTMQVGPEATRFNEVKKGDEVQIDYLESVAVIVTSPDKTVASAQGSNTAVIRNAGKKPSGMVVETDVITATVEKINAKKRTATLKGPQGNTIDINVAPDVEGLENVKVGDQLLVKVTRTVAIDVRKPTKK